MHHNTSQTNIHLFITVLHDVKSVHLHLWCLEREMNNTLVFSKRQPLEVVGWNTAAVYSQEAYGPLNN